MRLPHPYLLIFCVAFAISVVITLGVMQHYGYAPWQIYGQYR